MKRRIRILAWMLVLALTVGMIQWPTGLTAMASLGQVHVIVENTTYAKADGAAWDGTLLDEWVELKEDSNALSVVKDALDAKNMTQTGADKGYISEIAGLSEFDGGAQSGWMGTLNDWFTDQGLNQYTVAAGSLSAGDEVRMMYTKNWGADLGYDWSGEDESLASVVFSAGTLNQNFEAAMTSYTLTVPEGTTALTVVPTAVNKKFQTHIYADGVEYKRTAQIPVTAGSTVLKITCGTKEYTVAVQKEGTVSANVTIRSQMTGSYLTGLQTVTVSSDLAESYGYQDGIAPAEGVSTLDALVKEHELIFGTADFTPETAQQYLTVGSGYISMVFGYPTYGAGFFVNQGWPNDGTESSSGGYNGTLITTTKLVDGDSVDFFVYQDEIGYSDYYTWVTWPEDARAEEEVTVQVDGISAMMGYLYQTPSDMRKAATPLANAKLGWLDQTTGAVTEISGAVTDKDGNATIMLDRDVTQNTLVAMTNGDAGVSVLMNPSQTEIKPSEKVDAAITMNRISPKARLYRAEDTEHTEDLLAGVAQSGYAYQNLRLLPGTYVLEGIASNGVTVNGTIELNVTSENESFQIQTLEAYATNNSYSWNYGTDFTIENLKVFSGGGSATVSRKVTLGDSTKAGRKTFLALVGDFYTFEAVPTELHQEQYTTLLKSGSVTAWTTTASFAVPEKADLIVTYPYEDADQDGENDYILEVEQLSNYYIYNYLTPSSVKEDGENATASFAAAKNTDFTYRVTNPKKETSVAYGATVKTSATESNNEVTVTKELLEENSEKNKNTVVKDFSENKYDVGDLYLTVNEQGYVNLNAGDSYKLYAYRNWLTIGSITGNDKVVEPDFHVQVLDVDGTGAVSVTENLENTSGKHSFELKANHAGTSIVLVTYDALTNASAAGGSFFSAIWPENTGVFVVTVGAENGIETGMKINAGMNGASKLAGDSFDSELDVLYYTGKDGATYTFTPEEGTTVSMAVCQYINGKMTFGAFGTDGVAANADGSVTLSGLVAGKSIVKLEKDGKVAYQVLRAKQLNYSVYKGDSISESQKLYDSAADAIYAYTDGTKSITKAEYRGLSAEEQASYTELSAEPGENALLVFDRVYHPANKLSGVYNMAASIQLTGEDGTVVTGKRNQYEFASYAAAQQVKITIPSDWNQNHFKLSGVLKASGWGSEFGLHRVLTYELGKTANFGAVMQTGYFGNLENVSVPLASKNQAPVLAVTEKTQQMICLKDAQKTIDLSSIFSDPDGDTLKYFVSVNGAEAVPAEKLYTIPTDAEGNYEFVFSANDGLEDAAETYTIQLTVQNFDDAYQSTGNTLMSQDFTTTGSIGGEWKILGLARSGREIPDTYYQSAVSYIKSTMDADGRLSRTKSTENSRMILAMTALGYDASDINGMNLLLGLSDLSYVKKQGINGAIWALIALDSGKYEIPTSTTGNQVTREALVQEIIGAQMADGMWSLDGTNGEVDLTAMALQALAPYVSDAAVQAAVDLALQTLSAKQNVNGDFGTGSDASAETCAQVVVALTSLGIDPNTDSRFVKAEGSALNALLRYYENGMFRHVTGGSANQMATEQAYYAMVAYKRLLNGQTSLYDMSDVAKKQQPVIPDPTPNPTPKPEPSTPDLKPEDGPHTGDDSAPMSWYLLLMAGSAVCGLCLYRRRRF